MIGNLLRLQIAGFACFCTATLLAQAGMLGYLWSQGRLDRNRVAQIAVLVRDGQLPSAGHAQTAAGSQTASVTWDDIESARAVRMRQFELREQATYNVLKQVRSETEELSKERESFDRLYESFKKQLDRDKVTALTQGSENARLLLENIKSKQAKELIIQMLDADEIDDVVTLLGAMPIAKRAKIAAEFKTEEETGQLDEILRRIRRGLPDAAIIDQTREALDQAADQP